MGQVIQLDTYREQTREDAGWESEMRLLLRNINLVQANSILYECQQDRDEAMAYYTSKLMTLVSR